MDEEAHGKIIFNKENLSQKHAMLGGIFPFKKIKCNVTSQLLQ